MIPSAFGQFNIIDLSSHIAGPFCTKMFADYGANVVKIEPPSIGDVSRRIGPFYQDDPHPEKSLLYFYLNCNKRGITLNFDSQNGRQLLKGLLKEADILVEDFSPGYLQSIGLGYDEIRKLNPRIVMTSITPYGQTGPYKGYTGNDLTFYAMSGMMYTSGAYDREPLKHGHPQSYYMGGISAGYATSAALFSRLLTGQGQHIDLSLQESIAAHHYDSATRYSYTGTIERRAPKIESGSTKGTLFEGIVPVKDGYISPTMQRGRPTAPFSDYAKLIGRPDLDDTNFADRDLIRQHREELDETLLPILHEWNKLSYFTTAMSQGYVAGVVQTSEDLVNCPQLNERGFFTEVEHPFLGKIKMPGEMFRLPESPWSMRRPAPTLGQHNQEVFCGDLGCSKEELIRLRQMGVI